MSGITKFEPIIVADIGGTNARFAVVTDFDATSSQFVIAHHQTFVSAQFDSMQSLLAAYIQALPFAQPQRAALAVAGPMKGQTVNLTNLGWCFTLTELQSQFQLSQLKVINDFAAFAYAAPYLQAEQNLLVKAGTPEQNANIAVMGPGTGFGAAALVFNGESRTVLSCEAGHISLAAVTDLERQLLVEINKEVSHVSVENVFSGAGLERLYRAMAKVNNLPVEPYTAADISQLALSGQSDICHKTLVQFCEWIGSVAGDLALTFGARGGVFIGGGILPRMQEVLLHCDFSQRFVQKGIMTHYVQDIPVTLVTQDNIPFIGAAASLLVH
ncbi:glucokinase [Pseudoalteromonas tunicata]|uniref:glucokinase n=1 Tax=Pseudoalteromonas tunicata TaxID=314281 RepID=UPI00273E9A62|nr:glucokinase [Pseudoalteromonas tunicata]MDP4985205.1 glucokinase [Pseudoalteromonas tunicata]